MSVHCFPARGQITNCQGYTYSYKNLLKHPSFPSSIGSRFGIEICSVANGATKKEIGRAKEYIVKQLGLETGKSVEMRTILYMPRRFCSNLGMSNQSVKAAAVIYIITQLSDDKKLLRDISVATGVAEGTIRKSYKDLYPHLPKIIPAWYAKEEDLKNLQSP